MIRVADYEDRDIALELIRKNLESTPYQMFFTEEDLKKQVDDFLLSDNKDKLALLIEEDNKCIGLASFEILPQYSDVKFGRLTTVYIEPEYRSKGYMTIVVAAFEHWAKQVGCSFCNINILKGNRTKPKGYKKIETMYIKDIR